MSAESDNYLGFDCLELFVEETVACVDLGGLGIAIVGRSTFQDIADVDIVASEAHGFDDLCEQLAGSTYEWEALLVFGCSWGLAHEDDACVGVALAGHDIDASFGEGT